MTDVANLVLGIDSRQVKEGEKALDGLANAGERAERSTKKTTSATDTYNQSVARAKASIQGAEQSTLAYISRLERQVALYGKSATEALRYDAALMGMTRSQREHVEALLKTAEAQERASQASGLMATGFGKFTVIAASVLALVASLKQLTDIADAWTNVESRLKLVTASASELADVQQKLFNIAQQTRQSFPDLASTYAQIARSAKELGLSQTQLLTVTTVMSQAIAVSGGSAESAKAALIQLSQGMASGTLRGEELNSVMEQTPRLAQAIAEGLGIGIGQLRKMGAEGELTAAKVIGALEKSAKSVEAEFNKMTPTVSGGFTMLSNSAGNFIDKINDATKATRGLHSVLASISRLLDNMSSGIESGMERGRSAANERARQNVERQLAGMDPSDFRRKGLEAQLHKLNAESLAGGAEMPVLADAKAKGPSEEYLKVLDKLNGISSEYRKNLKTLFEEYNSGRLSVERYRQEVAKLIETETEIGKKTKKETDAAAKQAAKWNPKADFSKTMNDLREQAEKEYRDIEAKNKARTEADRYIGELRNKYGRENESKKSSFEIESESARRLREELLRVDDAARPVIEHLAKMYGDGKLPIADYARALSTVGIEIANQKARVTELNSEQDRLNASFEYGAERAIQKYLDSVKNMAAQSEQFVSRAFSSMEDALTKFVKTGKLDFRSLADSIITEIIRIQVRMMMSKAAASAGGSGFFGMLGAFLGFSGGSGGSGEGAGSAGSSDVMGVSDVAVAHTGGSIGQDSFITRNVPMNVFAGARRYHSGGDILGPDEVPIIAQKGERMLNRQEAAAYGKSPAPVVTINIRNEGSADGYQATASARQNGGGLDVDILVRKAVREDLRSNGPIAKDLATTFGLSRSAF